MANAGAVIVGKPRLRLPLVRAERLGKPLKNFGLGDTQALSDLAFGRDVRCRGSKPRRVRRAVGYGRT